MSDEQARALLAVLRISRQVKSIPEWHYRCLACGGRSAFRDIKYRPNLNPKDHPIEHEPTCPVPIVYGLLLSEEGL